MASFGEELKRERELRGISLKEIAEATKISIRFLEALEQDKFEMLPGGIFNRGFIRAYARFVGVDGEEMVNAYNEQVAAAAAQRREPGHPPAVGTEKKPHAPARVPAPRPPAPSKRAAAKPLPSVPARPLVQRVRELTKGRASLILWGLALVAFIIGAGVIALSLMRGNGVASPGRNAVARYEPPPAPGTGAAGVPAQTSAVPAPGADPNTTLLTAPAAADANTATPDPAERNAAGRESRRDGGEPFVSRPLDEPLRPAETGPLSTKPANPAPVAPPQKEHALTVIASEITRVRIECGGRVALFQELWPGQEAALKCEEPVVLSADNAGAVQYALGGSAPALLGAPGQRVDSATIAPVARPEKPGKKEKR